MEEKQFNKETKDNQRARAEYNNALRQADYESHSENHRWAYDHKSGSLKVKKGGR